MGTEEEEEDSDSHRPTIVEERGTGGGVIRFVKTIRAHCSKSATAILNA